MTKRGQAAMEFLMTYGWALLIVLVAIGALAYLGVLNPTRFIPEQCDMAPGIGCNAHKADSSGDAKTSDGMATTERVYLILQNGLGQSLGPVGADSGAKITLGPVTVGGAIVCTTGNEAFAAPQWIDGSVEELTFACDTPDTAWAVGDKLKATMTLSYTAGGIARTKQGQLVTTVEA